MAPGFPEAVGWMVGSLPGIMESQEIIAVSDFTNLPFHFIDV